MKYDIIVLGSGPGGYVAAIRASQLGKKVAIVERENLGGICLNWGCIPTKALLKSASVFSYINHAEDYGITVGNSKADFNKIIKRSRDVADGMSKGVQFLMKKNKIDVHMGHGKILSAGKLELDANGKKETLEADHIIIATGARAKDLPGLEIDHKKIIGYREALSLSKLPASMVVMGAGAIGVEFAYFYATLGVEVTIVEYLEQGLLPREDPEVSKTLLKEFTKAGIKTMAGTKINSIKTTAKSCKIEVENVAKGEKSNLEAEIVLSAAGIVPNTEDIGADKIGLELDRGFIKVDDMYRTNVPGIYAIGDVIPTIALAHVASAEGITCVENIAGMSPHPIRYDNIPSCTYCSPEVASVGHTEASAKEAGYDIRVGKFPLSASGKASAVGHKEGFIKVIFDKKYGEWLGCHMIGYNVTEMVAEVVVARNLETTGHEIIKSIHPHPTISEAIMEAAAAAYDEVIHL